MKIIFVLLVIFLCAELFAQDNSPSSQNPSGNFIRKNFQIFGDMGVYGELYKVSGQQNRRPPSTGRIFFRPTIELFSLIQIPFEFLISTEGSSARQNINQFGINPRWSWGSLNIGDFSTEYSIFTLSGVLIRGGGITLTPGNFRFSTVAGFTSRAVAGGAQDGSFKRFLFASKIGYGNESDSYLDLILVRAKDDIKSLNQKEKTITIISPNGNDVLNIGESVSIVYNSFGITGNVRIELSRDGGFNYEIIANDYPNVGFYNWTVTGPPTFQALIKVVSIDDSTVYDISDNFFTIGSGVQTSIAPSATNIINKNAVTPQENLVVGTKGKISFLKNKLTFDFDAAGSVYTKDLRATELNLDSANVPSFITKVYKPRIGTNVDFALNSILSLNFSSFSTKIGFKRIQPGYNSLGTSYLLNDIQEFSLMNFIRISPVNLNVSYVRQNDNLLNQKLFTTRRDMINAGLNAALSKKWNASLSTNILTMKNNAADSIKTEFMSYVINTNQAFLINPQGFFRSIIFNYSYQNTTNKSYNNKNDVSIHTFNLGLNFLLIENLIATFNGGIIKSRALGTNQSTTENYGLVFQHSALQNKLISNANIGFAKSSSSSSLRISIGSGYQIALSDNISILVSYMNSKSSLNRGGSFEEIISSLTYSHRF